VLRRSHRSIRKKGEASKKKGGKEKKKRKPPFPPKVSKERRAMGDEAGEVRGFAVEFTGAAVRGGAVPIVTAWCPTMDLCAVAFAAPSQQTAGEPATDAPEAGNNAGQRERAAASSEVLLFRCPQWECIATFKGGESHDDHSSHGHGHKHAAAPTASTTDDGGAVTSLAWRPDGKVLAVGRAGGGIALFSVESSGVLFCPRLHSAVVVCLDWSLHGGSSDRRLNFPSTGTPQDNSEDQVYAPVSFHDPLEAGNDHASQHEVHISSHVERWDLPDAASLALPPLMPFKSELGTASGGRLRSAAGTTHIRDSDVAMSSVPRSDILVSCDASGIVCLSIQGTFCVVRKDLNVLCPHLERPVATHSSLSADQRNLLLVVESSAPGGHVTSLVSLDVAQALGRMPARLRILARNFWRLMAAQHHASHSIKTMRKAWSSAEQAIATPFEKLHAWLRSSRAEENADGEHSTARFLDEVVISGEPDDSDALSQFLEDTITSSSLRKVRKSSLAACAEQLRILVQHLRPACLQLVMRVDQLRRAADLDEMSRVAEPRSRSPTQRETPVLLDAGCLEESLQASAQFAERTEAALRDLVELRSDMDTLFSWLLLEQAARAEAFPPHLGLDTFNHLAGLDILRLHEFLQLNAEAEREPRSMSKSERDSAFAGTSTFSQYLTEITSADEGSASLEGVAQRLRETIENLRDTTCQRLGESVRVVSSTVLTRPGENLSISVYSPPASWNVGSEQHVVLAQQQPESNKLAWLLRNRIESDVWDAQVLIASECAGELVAEAEDSDAEKVFGVEVHTDHRLMLTLQTKTDLTEGVRLVMTEYEPTLPDRGIAEVDAAVLSPKSESTLIEHLSSRGDLPELALVGSREVDGVLDSSQVLMSASRNRGLALLHDGLGKVVLVDLENEEEDESDDEESDDDSGDAEESDDASDA
jgi:Anaphase-promoting complex, cyclosome, subunit 4/Anaphase-promoting complex subunit 4 WD40 domain